MAPGYLGFSPSFCPVFWDRPLLVVPTCSLGSPWLSLYSSWPNLPLASHHSPPSPASRPSSSPLPTLSTSPSVLFKGACQTASLQPPSTPSTDSRGWGPCRAHSYFSGE